MTGYATHLAAAAGWPILLLGAVDHSRAVAEVIAAADSDFVDRTLWIPVGRDEPTSGAAVEVVEHRGTYRDTLAAARWAGEQAATGEHGTTLLVVDCVSALWTALYVEARLTVAERAAAHGFPVTPAGVEVSHDLWDARSQRWHRFVNTVRRHPGPVLLTAYLDEVALTNEAGDRTTTARWEWQAERNLARSLSGAIQWRTDDGAPVLTGFAGIPDLTTPAPGLTVADVWAAHGLEPGAYVVRRHSATWPLSADGERRHVLRELLVAADAAGQDRDELAERWAADHQGQPISAGDLDELERLRDALTADAAARQEQPA